ncbi:MAG: nicotinate-nucleotide--dimethylbenzimidazole phosphoribosyltransferase [Sheuella sp.]|nr:nicotinate-nucleotide--dimethylbenzimidazole phosphoribosyltransferase [Sheuella sp.]
MNLAIPKILKLEDLSLVEQLTAKINNKTKPLGSLGQLESLAVKIGNILGTTTPCLTQPQLVVYAADHGIVKQGVSAFPSDVTWQMVQNFLADGAAVSVLARQHDVSLTVVDCGVKHVFEAHPRLIVKKLGDGTADSSCTVAMSVEVCQQAVQNGIEIVRALPGNVLILGEMGIGNTSAASLLFSKLSGIDIEQCTGAGTGLDSDAVIHKTKILRQALEFHHTVPDDKPLEVLAATGGFEIATMVGSLLEAAASRRVILVDGFIVSAALLVASRIDSSVLDYCVFAHRSGERGHTILLDHLKGVPLLDLGLRLGEGSGAMIAWPLLQSACVILNEMASFEAAGVSRESVS